jgi:hypothetical protein
LKVSNVGLYLYHINQIIFFFGVEDERPNTRRQKDTRSIQEECW